MSQLRRTWVTQETYDRLSRELAALTDGGENSAEIEFAHVPDEEARRARIGKINEILRDAVVGEAPPDDGIAEPGMVLTVQYAEEDEPETFLLGVRDRSSFTDLTVYSPESPLGQAIMGAKPGEQRSYKTPNGKTIHVTLKGAEPYGRHQDRSSS